MSKWLELPEERREKALAVVDREARLLEYDLFRRADPAPDHQCVRAKVDRLAAEKLSALRAMRRFLDDAKYINGEHGPAELSFCVGSECIRNHGVRLATRKGVGPCSIYIVCDECFTERLTATEREHMVELMGASWVRHLGLHELHNGCLPGES